MSTDALSVVRLAHERAKQTAAEAQKVAQQARCEAERAAAEVEAIDHFLKYKTTFESIAKAAGCRVHVDQSKAMAAFYVPILGDAMLKMMQAFYPSLEQVEKEKAEEAKQAERRAIAKERAKILQSLVKNPEDPEDSEDTDNRRIEVINP